MTGHGNTRLMLYEYIRGELDARDTRRVEEHLARCPECAREAAGLRSVLKVVPDSARRPSDALPDSYWKGFANEVMGRIEPGPVDAPGFIGRIAARITGPRALAGGGGFSSARGFPGPFGSPVMKLSAGLAAAVVAGAVLFFAVPWGSVDRPDAGSERIAERSSGPPQEPWRGEAAGETGGDSVEKTGGPPRKESAGNLERRAADRDRANADPAGGFSPDSLTEFDRRLYDYFRRSKALLVGVSNLDPAEEETADLGTERSISRSLLREARYLKTGPVDLWSYRLMDDLDQIMIGLANSDARTAVPAVEIIRDGIETKNLLFKLRMQETSQYQTPFRQASYHR